MQAAVTKPGAEDRIYCYTYIRAGVCSAVVKLLQIYQCLCDETRLRILHLLAQGPLCVCHFQAILGASQVKVSKHLAYLRARHLVQTSREGSWIIYALPDKPSRELTVNLQCLQDCVRESPIFRADLRRRRQALAGCASPLAASSIRCLA